MAVETAAENNFIKRVVDVEYKNRPNGADFWVLGGRRDGVGKPFKWFQTGKTVTYQNWASSFPGVHARLRKVYIYMHKRSMGRRWGAYTGTEYNIICETSFQRELP